MTWRRKKSPSSEFDNPRNQPSWSSPVSKETRAKGPAAGRKMRIAVMLRKAKKPR